MNTALHGHAGASASEANPKKQASVKFGESTE